MDDLERDLAAALRKAMVKGGTAGDTFTVLDMFPGLNEEVESLLAEEKSADARSMRLFALAMEKLAHTTRRLEKGVEFHKALEKRIEALEKVQFAYDGPYVPRKEYRRGKFVSYNGSMWHCNHLTFAKPGDGPDWTLAVKSPR